ncbi:MAG: hypothetical protein FJ292_01080 [Planctomycetes bacterium]|nr:hypothetical protein [Planctomycetota bacterium]
MRTTLAAFATCLTVATAFGQVTNITQLSEIRTQQTGVDLQIYVEIAGTAATSLNDLSLVIVGNDDFALPPAQNGSIESVVNLTGQAIPSSGFFVMAEPTYTLTVPDLVSALGIGTDNNKTFLLVRNFSGFPGDDIDLNDDGTIDNPLWSEIVSDVALMAVANPDGISGDYVYSANQVGPDGGSFVSYAKKCPITGLWQVGLADVSVAGDTPGAANPACTAGFVQINEIRIDQTGTDNDEYAELSGQPGTSLADFTYVVIGDGNASTKSGVAECIIPLTGQTIPASGIFLITLKNTSGQDGIAFGRAGDLQTAALTFENGDHVTHILVRGWTGGAIGTDLDLDDDGELDIKPWASVVDSVGFVKFAATGPVKAPDVGTNLGEWTYSVANEIGGNTPMVGPDTTFVPGHIYRCSPQGGWKIGSFDPVGAGSNNKDTPKAVNPECSACGEPGSGSCFLAHANPGCDKGSCCSAVCSFIPTCCETQWDSNCASTALANCLEPGNPPELELSEMRLRDPDNVVNNIDQNEYLELTGAPGTSLTGVSIVVLNNLGVNGNNQPNTGVIRAAVSLNGLSIGASGRFLVTEQTFALSGVSTDFNCGGGLVFDNSGALSVYLVWNYYGAIGTDLDAEDDGIIDAAPWMSAIAEVGVIGDTGAVYASPSVGPSNGTLPAQVYRCVETGEWTIGPGSITTGYDTPGAVNGSCSLPRIFSCGDSDAGDCYLAHPNSHCFNRACCEAVCAAVPDCCNVAWDDACVTAAGTLTACGGGNSPVVISEARMDQSGDDVDEYVELSGAPGTALDGLAFIVLGDATVSVGGTNTDLKSGAVECVVDLAGQTIPASGKFLITVKNEATGTAARDGTIFKNYASAGLSPVAGDLQTASLNLENTDNVTLVLVQGFTGAINTDLDTNDDGVIDITPWDAVLDKVSVVTSIRTAPPTGSTVEWWYAPRIGPNSAGTPSQIYRCSPVGYWFVGNGYFLDPATRTDTPGAENTACPNAGGCFGDVDGSLEVDNGDVAFALIDFGACPGCPTDLDGSGEVDFGDVALILLSTGPCQ